MSTAPPSSDNPSTTRNHEIAPAPEDTNQTSSSGTRNDEIPPGASSIVSEIGPAEDSNQTDDKEKKPTATTSEKEKQKSKWDIVRSHFLKHHAVANATPSEKQNYNWDSVLPHIFQFLKSLCKKNKVADAPEKDDKNVIPSENSRKFNDLSKLINEDITFILSAYERIINYKNQINKLSQQFNNLKKVDESSISSAIEEMNKIKKIVQKFKQQIPIVPKDESSGEQHTNAPLLPPNSSNGVSDLQKLPELYKSKAFETHADFKQFESRYKELDLPLRLCLLCFSVFPENAIIKKRVLIYWWIGEGFVPPIGQKADTASKKTAEQCANEFFNKLVSEGFIQPVREKRRPPGAVDTCKMDPFVRSMVIQLARKANFFNFQDDDGIPKEDNTDSLRYCLTGKGSLKIKDLRKLHSLFNVSQTILEFNSEWFSKMRNVNVLYLGRWQTSSTHHIEVEYTIRGEKLLDGLKSMKHLRFLSLHGISRITQLPESILRLANLTILDLRACHNLEVIPDEIGFLKNLTHLDMSECYLLDKMPKEIASLSQLQVLGGFVVGVGSEDKNSSCSLDDLKNLKKLRKLSIHTGNDNFPSISDRQALYQLEELIKLTIKWGRGSKRDSSNRKNRKDSNIVSMPAEPAGTENVQKTTPTMAQPRLVDKPEEGPSTLANPFLPSKLIKLDLHCFPWTITHDWPVPSKLLKKLYIRGGKFPFPDLGRFRGVDYKEEAAYEWEVEDLRLKYLADLEMDWSQLQGLFPKLNYLEIVKCPKLTFIPCDEDGVWMKTTVR